MRIGNDIIRFLRCYLWFSLLTFFYKIHILTYLFIKNFILFVVYIYQNN